MIEYKCDNCGNTLETDDSLSGQQEQCPVCRKVNTVPLSKKDMAKQREILEATLEEAQRLWGIEQAKLALQVREARRLRDIEQAKLAAKEKEAQRQREELFVEEGEARRLQHIEQAKLSAIELEAQRQREVEEDARRALLEQQRLQKEQELKLHSLPDPSKPVSLPPISGNMSMGPEILAELRHMNKTLSNFISSRSTASVEQLRIPSYSGVAVIAVLYQVLGVLSMAIGVVLAVLSFTREDTRMTAFDIMVIVILLINGLVLIGFGEVFSCIRDSSRNSFYLKRLQ